MEDLQLASHTPCLKNHYCSSSLGTDGFMGFIEHDSIPIMNTIPIIVLFSIIRGFKNVS